MRIVGGSCKGREVIMAPLRLARKFTLITMSVLLLMQTLAFASAPPGAPEGVGATAGNAQATVTFSPPAADGGSPILSYTVTSSPGNLSASGTSSPLAVTGLQNGIAYSFTVTAVNAFGSGPLSPASNAVTPWGEPKRVIPVPYNPGDPAIPHPAYNGRATLFKAIARGMSVPTVYYRWDIDGDGRWDACANRGQAVAGWYRNDIYNLDCLAFLPTASIDSHFAAVIEVKEDVSLAPSFFASYPVLVHSSVPVTAAAETASASALGIMREAAVADALWYLHTQLARVNQNSSRISGYLNSSSGTPVASALFLIALQNSGHLAAYPRGTYNPLGKAVPPEFELINDQRWRDDPYAEDAVRLINYLLSLIQSGAIPALDEESDGQERIPGTTDGEGYFFPASSGRDTEWNTRSLPVAALAASSLAGSVAQVDHPALLGRSMENIVQQLIDFGAAAQVDASAQAGHLGGWGYSPCFETCTGPQASPYHSGGWYYALVAAETAMGANGVYVNARTKSRIASYLASNQHADGGAMAGASNPAMTASVFEPVGYALLAARWLGWDGLDAADSSSAGYPDLPMTKGEARQVYDRYLAYLDSRWTTAGGGYLTDSNTALWATGNFNSDPPNQSYHYSIFGVRSGAGAVGLPAGPTLIGPHDWLREFSIAYLKNQTTAGQFPDYSSNYWLLNWINPSATLYGLATLAGFPPPPVPPAPPVAEPATMVGAAGFTANWSLVSGAVYRLDVASDSGFTNFVPGYQQVDVGTGSSWPVTGLAPGTTCYYRVWAVNSSGLTSDPSGSIQVTTLTVPGAPDGVSAVAGNSSAIVTFSLPAFDGGTPITSCLVVATPGEISAVGAGSPITVSGLTNGVHYTFTVAAINAVGTGPASAASNSVTPFAPEPVSVLPPGYQFPAANAPLRLAPKDGPLDGQRPLPRP